MGVPKIDYRPPISDLFSNFGTNWNTLSPALWLLYGTLFAFFVLGIMKKYYND